MAKRHVISNTFTYKVNGDYIKFLDRSNENLLRYLSEVRYFEPLTPEEEKEVIKDLGKGGETTAKAREKLIIHNQRFVVSQAKRMCPNEMDICDFISEGNRGLIEAVDTFDPKVGASFLRHASAYIFKYQSAFLKNNYLIKTKNRERVSTTLTTKFTNEFILENQREPSVDELFQKYVEAGVKLSDKRDLIKIDIESIITSDDSDDDKVAKQYGEIDDFDTRLNNRLIAERLKQFMTDNLTPNEKYVLESKYGFYNGIEKSPETIAIEIGMTKEEVEANIKSGLKKIKEKKYLFE